MGDKYAEESMRDSSAEVTGETHERQYRTYKDCFLKRSLGPHEWKPAYGGRIHEPYDAHNRLENEAVSLRFIKSNTNIPVPKVLSTYVHKGSFYLWTELLPGVSMSKLSPPDQATVILEVEEHLRTLHGLRSNTIGGPTGLICPPIRAVDVFDSDKKWVAQSSPTDDFVFCHNDLSQHNIMVNPDTLRITGILDWESAGYFPPFFEAPFFRSPRPSGAQVRDMEDNNAQLVEFLTVCVLVIVIWEVEPS